jgi:hypothetical protein
VSPVKYELGFYIPEDHILHSHRREILKSYANGQLDVPALVPPVHMVRTAGWDPDSIWKMCGREKPPSWGIAASCLVGSNVRW